MHLARVENSDTKRVSLFWHTRYNILPAKTHHNHTLTVKECFHAGLHSRPTCQILTVFWAWGQTVEKVSIFTAKGTHIREYTSFKPFCVKCVKE